MTPALTIMHTALALLCCLGLWEAGKSRDWLIVALYAVLIAGFVATIAALNGVLA